MMRDIGGDFTIYSPVLLPLRFLYIALVMVVGT